MVDYRSSYSSQGMRQIRRASLSAVANVDGRNANITTISDTPRCEPDRNASQAVINIENVRLLNENCGPSSRPRELASQQRPFGYRRLGLMLKRQGIKLSVRRRGDRKRALPMIDEAVRSSKIGGSTTTAPRCVRYGTDSVTIAAFYRSPNLPAQK